MNRRERLKAWATELSAEQMHSVIVELVCFAIDAEMISFSDETLAPYWSNDGEPVIDGQNIFPEEE